SPSSSPSSSASKSFNPLDPLGLGDKLRDILTGGHGEHGEEKPGEPPSTGTSPAPPAPPVSPSPSASPSAGGGDKAKPEPGVGARKPSTAPSSAPPSAPSSPGTSASPSPGASSSASPGTGTLPPCPKPDVVDEKEGHAFPIQPWYLESSALTLHGLTYQGIKRIKMVNGQEKNVLKFTADAVTIKDLHQIVNTYGRESHITGPGTNSTITGDKVTLYTEELKGKLLGIIPTTQSPTSPPPLIPGLKVPIPLLFTDVKLRQGGQFGGTLHIENLHQYYTDGTYP
ncbi:hydrogenase expression protein HypF, partial [Streptomyces sp. UNOC14_S4]|nr:hydrogenase expression protein HypF [Streptomyces sp. UNOC14_S4]